MQSGILTGNSIHRRVNHSLAVCEKFNSFPDHHFIQKQENQQNQRNEGDWDVQLCFVPLQVMIDLRVSPEEAYIAAAHVFLQWNGHSAGFTRLEGEEIGDARVIVPEPRVNDSNKHCFKASLRTIPTSTPGQSISFTPVGAISDIVSYGSDFLYSYEHCQNPSFEFARQRFQSMLVDNRRGLYNLFDENCEMWVLNVLAAGCMEATEIILGHFGNIALRIARETPAGTMYHLARLILNRTRPMPEPQP